MKTKAVRAFYEAEALREGPSVRQPDRQIGSSLFERCALSRNRAVGPGSAMKSHSSGSSPGHSSGGSCLVNGHP
jgi:predicted nuclease of restriction endonuclease-like (RecB) superfamily